MEPGWYKCTLSAYYFDGSAQLTYSNGSTETVDPQSSGVMQEEWQIILSFTVTNSKMKLKRCIYNICITNNTFGSSDTQVKSVLKNAAQHKYKFDDSTKYNKHILSTFRTKERRGASIKSCFCLESFTFLNIKVFGISPCQMMATISFGRRDAEVVQSYRFTKTIWLTW